jgi:transcription elongation GreA/GreB family factor
MRDNARDKFWRKALTEAGKKIKVLPARNLNDQLEYAAGDLAEAYRIGVEEAQGEILSRLRTLQERLADQSTPVSASEPNNGTG